MVYINIPFYLEILNADYKGEKFTSKLYLAVVSTEVPAVMVYINIPFYLFHVWYDMLCHLFQVYVYI